MAAKDKKLSPASVAAEKPGEKPKKLSDGGGLFLYILPTGAKSWRLKYRFGGVEKLTTFGLYPVITLQQARERAVDAKRLLAKGIDPQEAKKTAKNALKNSPAKLKTFGDVAREVFKLKEMNCTQGYADNYRRSIELHLMPLIGDKPIKHLSALDVLDACRTASTKGKYLSHKLAQRAREVFDQAVTGSHIQYNPLNSKSIHKNLPTKPITASHRAFGHENLPEFYRDLRASRAFPITKLMMEFEMHTCLRTIEVRRLQWEHINFDKAPLKMRAEQDQNDKRTWTPAMAIDIPSGRELNRKDAPIVPMSKQVLRILSQAREIVGEGNADFVFPMFRNYSKMASENVILQLLKGMGWKDEMTGHGFRALGFTTLEEVGKFQEKLIDLQLGHKIATNETQAAYRRVEFWHDRVLMMQWWSDFLESKNAESMKIK